MGCTAAVIFARIAASSWSNRSRYVRAGIFNSKSCNALEKPYDTPLEAALRWCRLIAHEIEIKEKLGKSGMPGPADFPQWPCLRANAEKIYDAMLNDELSFGRDGKKIDADDQGASAR